MAEKRRSELMGAGALAFACLLATASPVLATTAASITIAACGGGLAFITSASTAAYPITLGATNTASTPVAMSFDVGDCTGSGSGWNITAQQSANFISAGHTLKSTAGGGNAIGTNTNAVRPVATCDGNTCGLAAAGTGPVTYPGTVFGTASGNKLYQAGAGTGMGNQTVALTIGIGTITTANYAGTYNATWLFTLVSGP